MDKYKKEVRSRMMAAVKSRDTKPEILVRRFLFQKGFRYRLNDKRFPGHPDIVLPRYKTCVFINGCFWHGHECPSFRLPKSNQAFWKAKIARNKARDLTVYNAIKQQGWNVITIWECELTKNRIQTTLENLELSIRCGVSGELGVAYYQEAEMEGLTLAAEDEETYDTTSV